MKPAAFEARIGYYDDVPPRLLFDGMHSGGCAAGQRGGDLRGDDQPPAPPRLSPLFTAQRAQGFVRERDRSFCPDAAGRGFEQRLAERSKAARAHQFEMAEPGPAQDLRPRRIGGERPSEGGAHPLARGPVVEADKIDDDRAAEIAQPELPGDNRGGGQIDREGGPLRRAGFGRGAVDIDQICRSRHLEMDRTRIGKRDGRRQRFVEQGVEVDRPLGFGCPCYFGIGKGGADFRDRAGLVDQDAIQRRQSPGESGGKARSRGEPRRRIEMRGAIRDVPPLPNQARRLGYQLIERRGRQQAKPDRFVPKRPFTRRSLTRLAAPARRSGGTGRRAGG